MWVREEQKYVRESLKTEDRELAIGRAQNRFIFYRARILNNEKVFSIAANELRDRFLVHIQKAVAQGQLSLGRAVNIKTHTKHYLNFVGRTSKIQNIDSKKFREYLSFRRKSKEDILATVVINESTTIKQMYKFACDEGLIDQSYRLDFGVIKKLQGEAVRSSYTIAEYTALTNISRTWYKKKDAKTDEERFYRRIINDFVLVMSNGGFRTQEARLLKWKDIKIITKEAKEGQENYAEVVVRAENSKVRKSRTIEMRRGDVFERIKKYSAHTEREDFVFTKYDSKDVLDKTHLYDYFNAMVAEVKKEHNDFDDTKSLYCLRHFWITIRILAGLNVYDIAKISGTSLQQIQKHYDAAASLVTSQKMNKNMLRFDKRGNVVVEAVEW